MVCKSIVLANRPISKHRMPVRSGWLKRRMTLLLFNDWVERLTPVFNGVIHHDVDEHRHQKPEDLCAVPNLRSVDTAVPG
jgi:hypothetical protein